MSRATRNKSCQAVQRGEVEVQTDPLERNERWTQIPGGGGGGGSSSSGGSSGGSVLGLRAVDPLRLAQFTFKAERLIASLLSSKNTTASKSKNRNKEQNAEGKDSIHLTCPSVAQETTVSIIACGPNGTFATVQNIEKSSGSAEKSLITLWPVGNAKHKSPLLTLVARSHVTCISWLSSHSNVIGAGLLDGSLACWDASEPDEETIYKLVDNFKLRIPSYYSAGSSSATVAIVSQAAIIDLRSSFDSKFISIDESGLISIIQPIFKTLNTVSEDVQQSPHSSVRLQLANTIKTEPEATCLALLDAIILVGYQNGSVHSFTQSSSRKSNHLMEYKPQPGQDNYCSVKSILIHGEDKFFVGYHDTTVAIFLLSHSQPISITLPKSFSLTKLMPLGSQTNNYAMLSENGTLLTYGRESYRDERSNYMVIHSTRTVSYLLISHPKGKIQMKEMNFQ